MYRGISKGILLRKNAVGIATDFLNEETDPFPRPRCVPSWKPFSFKLRRDWLILGLCDLAVQHGPWVGIACLSPLLIWDCPAVTAGSRQACLLCFCPCPFFSAAAVLVPGLYWATIAHRAPLLLTLIFFPWILFLMSPGL